MHPLRGVNLGGWLVLEKWMTPELYEGSDALDEYHLLQDKPDLSWLDHHRDTFITEDDFKWLSSHGITHVRLPVGWWLFDAKPPYKSATETFFKALLWADAHAIKVILDVHAAPGCQNGFDNGGLQGVIDWPKGDNVEQTLRFIETLVEKTKSWTCVTGIELLNEPFKTVDMNLIQDFYLKAYEIVRRIKGDDYQIIMHDGFRLDAWEDFFTQNALKNVYLDTHMYHTFGEIDQDANFDAFKALYEKRLNAIKNVQAFVPVVVGEWSNPLLSEQFNTDPRPTDDMLRNDLFKLQTDIFNHADGWFFWSYKLSEKSLKTHPGWSYRYLIDTHLTSGERKLR